MEDELKQRIEAYEKKVGKKLKELNEEETIEACMEIMSLTRTEAEEYLNQVAASSLLYAKPQQLFVRKQTS